MSDIIVDARDGRYVVIGDGAAFVSLVEAEASARSTADAALASQALASSTVLQALAGASVAIPVNSNPNELTAQVPTLAVNSNFEVLISQTNTGETWLTAGGVRRRITNGGGVSIPAGGLAAGTIVTLNNSPGGAFVLIGSRPLPGSDATIGPLSDKVDTVSSTAEGLSGAAISYPVNDSPNELVVSTIGTPAVNANFDVLIPKTNTAETYLTAGTVRLRVADGGGTSIPAGGLVANTIATFNRSPGGAYILTASRPLKEADYSQGATKDVDLAQKPWGTVTFTGSTRNVAAVNKYVIVPGSSNAATPRLANAQLPALVAAAALNEFFPGTDTVFTGRTVAAEGAPMAAIASQLAGSTEYQNGQASWVIPFFWMNDARTIFYHSQGGILAEIAALRAAIPSIRDKGAEPVLVTGFPPDPRASTVALDPTWFSNAAAYPTGGSTQGMDYPAARAAPVNPVTQMQPPSSAPLTEARAWTKTGIKRVNYKRIWHVNRLIRLLAAEKKCVLLDLEYSAYLNAIETVPDLGAGLDTFYDSADSPHPKPAMYDAVVTPVLREWAFAVAQGRTDQRVFRGDGA